MMHMNSGLCFWNMKCNNILFETPGLIYFYLIYFLLIHLLSFISIGPPAGLPLNLRVVTPWSLSTALTSSTRAPCRHSNLLLTPTPLCELPLAIRIPQPLT